MAVAALLESAAPVAIAPVLAPLPVEPEWLRRADELGYRWARLAWDRAAKVPGAWFDAAKADKTVATWPQVFRLTDDRFAGKPFRLTFWQECIVRLLVGWKAPVEVKDPETGETTFVYARLFRQLRLWIPRKNGKSEFLAALALLFWALEGVVRGQGFCFAADEQQGRMVFDKMSDMVGFAPRALKDHVAVFNKYLWIQRRKSAFRLLSGKPAGKHGRGPVVIVGDEMHEWQSTALMTTLRQGTGTRLQPIELYASTAGPRSAKVGWRLWDESKKILEGVIEDPTTLVVIFAADEDDDWTDERTLAKANPSLGLSPTIAFLRREIAYARESPRAEAEFRCFHLNQWVEEFTRWLPKKKWDACAPDKEAWRRFPDELDGRECFGAIDASARNDITALVWLFPPKAEGERFKLVCRFWVPEDTIAERKKDRVDYETWRKMGALEATQGDSVDQNALRQAVKDGLARYKVRGIGIDPWNTLKLVTDLQNDGVDRELMIDVRQGHKSLGEASVSFERLVVDGVLDHGGNPVLTWMAGHTVVRFDENLNIVPAKKQSTEKIDGIVASVMAVALFSQGDAGFDIDAFLANAVMR